MNVNIQAQAIGMGIAIKTANDHLDYLPIDGEDTNS
jgi:hypothetical protein